MKVRKSLRAQPERSEMDENNFKNKNFQNKWRGWQKYILPTEND